MSSTALAAGIVIGGLTISGLGAATVYTIEKKQPTIKSIMRDFIIGCVLVLMLVQLIPDSVQSLVGFLPSAASVLSGAAAMASSVAEPSNEMEIQVGVPGF